MSERDVLIQAAVNEFHDIAWKAYAFSLTVYTQCDKPPTKCTSQRLCDDCIQEAMRRNGYPEAFEQYKVARLRVIMLTGKAPGYAGRYF